MCNTCCFRAFDGHLCTCYPCQWNDESFEYLQIQRFFAQLGSLENKIIAASKSLSWLSIIYWIGCYIMCWQSAHSVNAQIQKILLMKAIKVTFKHYNLWVCSQKNFRIFVRFLYISQKLDLCTWFYLSNQNNEAKIVYLKFLHVSQLLLCWYQLQNQTMR